MSGFWGTLGSVGGFLVGGPGGAAAGGALGGAADNSGGGGGGPVGQGFAGPNVAGMSPEDQAKLAAQQSGPNGPNPGAWGGTNGAGNADVGMFRQQAQNYGDLRAPGMDYGSSDGYYGQGAQSRVLGMDDRGAQQNALGMMQNAAMGNGPSVAQIQQQQGMNNAMASQLSLAAGARGASGLAQAGYTAAGNVAGLQGQAATQGGMLRAGEMAHAMDAYGGMASGIRGQDMNQRSQDLATAQALDARTQFGANMGLNYRQLGMQGQLAYDQMGNQIRGAQMGQYQNSEANRLQQFGIQMGRDAGSAHDANSNYQFGASQVIGGVKGAAGGGAAG